MTRGFSTHKGLKLWQKAALVSVVILWALPGVYRFMIRQIALARCDALIASLQKHRTQRILNPHTTTSSSIWQPTQKFLDFSDTAIADDDLWCISQVDGLTQLDLARTSVSDRGIVQIASHQTIRLLNLESTLVTDQCLRNLKFAPRLQILNVSRTQITLESCPRFDRLETFSGTDCPIENDGASRLLSLAPNLVAANLAGTSITNSLYSVIGAHPTIQAINLSRTAVSGEFFDQLECGSLTWLWLDEDQYADAAVSRLKARCPKIRSHLAPDKATDSAP